LLYSATEIDTLYTSQYQMCFSTNKDPFSDIKEDKALSRGGREKE
jgi:hypothetical protein